MRVNINNFAIHDGSVFFFDFCLFFFFVFFKKLNSLANFTKITLSQIFSIASTYIACIKFATRLKCDNWTNFGSPVVPLDVSNMAAVVLGFNL